jgi:hypothetical protein|tara:strand:- start:672 stop:794 length:123 start_codon:yes stop_codon:yes gene_type:complete
MNRRRPKASFRSVGDRLTPAGWLYRILGIGLILWIIIRNI